MEDQQIKNLVDQLIALGEDKDEMGYWLSIFPYLTEENQGLLYANLRQEVEALTSPV